MTPFIKMHGCGNDYVFLDGFQQAVPADPAALAIRISDRHCGIGADGLVLMLPEEPSNAVARMRMFNADGSEGSLCGNALRCMAMWLFQSGLAGPKFGIAMGNRTIAAEVISSDPVLRRGVVRVRIGAPEIVNPGGSGRQAFAREVSVDRISIPGLLVPPLYVSMGNPHTVLFVRSLAGIDFDKLGPLIENHAAFPDRTNVEFVEAAGPLEAAAASSRPRVPVRVWERGSGETQACGSGACAVAVAGYATGLFGAENAVMIAMKGGDLTVSWDVDHQVDLEGPAAESFRGELNI